MQALSHQLSAFSCGTRRIIHLGTSVNSDVRVDATVSLSTDGSYVLNPVQDLPKGNYRATITTEVTDLADNALEDPVVWTFTVEN